MILMFTICIISITLAFYTIFMFFINDFQNKINSIEVQVERYVEISDSLSKMITIYGNDFFLQERSEDSELYSYIEYDPQSNSYHLDNIKQIGDITDIGNITGYGKVPTKGRVKDEINLAFQFFQLFKNVHGALPDIAWLYYVSASDFIGMYPWISSADFKFSDNLKNRPYFSRMLPEANPSREANWIPIYMDNAGKGYIVTLSSPLYDGDEFKGVVCIDLTRESISKLLKSSYRGYLIDEHGSVIASSKEENNKNITEIGNVLSYSREEWDMLVSNKENQLLSLGGNIVYYKSISNAPWSMVYYVSILSIIIKTTIYVSPIILICLLLIFASIQVFKQKKVEALLQSSLDELTSYQAILENAAYYDFLTKAYNRRGLLLRLDDRIRGNNNRSVSMSFILCDIDHFKKINDTHGHSAGDKILMELTKYLKQQAKELDVVCRWGGEEFVLLLYGCSYQNAIWNAKELRKGIEELEIMWEGVYISITMTFGVVEYNYVDSLEECIEKADQALYKGKESGRNCVVGYTEGSTDIYK